jgi:hypothetical protein
MGTEALTEWASMVLGLSVSVAMVAMEYYALILNRTFLIVGHDTTIAGAKVHGIHRASLGSPDHRFDDPRSFISPGMLSKLVGSFPNNRAFLNQARGNFLVDRHNLTSVTYDERPKPGMGNIPHSGSVVLAFDGRTREFILLGRQDGPGVVKALGNLR